MCRNTASLSPILRSTRIRLFAGQQDLTAQRCRQAIISDGCIISDAHLERSVIVGIRSVIQNGATIRNSVVMGADYFELDQTDSSQPPMGIGKNCVIDRAIIDKNAHVGMAS